MPIFLDELMIHYFDRYDGWNQAIIINHKGSHGILFHEFSSEQTQSVHFYSKCGIHQSSTNIGIGYEFPIYTFKFVHISWDKLLK